jgi:hypothetical protein
MTNLSKSMPRQFRVVCQLSTQYTLAQFELQEAELN